MAIGHRLRIIRLVPTAAAFYGSDNYGDATYGQRATDTADLQRYSIVPLDFTANEQPQQIVRRHDTTEFRCRLIAFQSEYETDERSGTVLDLSGVETATLCLNDSSVSNPGDDPIIAEAPMDINAADDTLSIDFSTIEGITGNRTYRLTIRLDFFSGRRLTLPPDDSFKIVAVPSTET